MGESQVAPSVRLKYFLRSGIVFDGGLYFRTYETDSDEDWDEGFYSIL